MGVARRTVHGAVAAGVLATGMVFGGGVASAGTCTADGHTYSASDSVLPTTGLACPSELVGTDSLTELPDDTSAPSTPTTTEAPPTTTDEPAPSAPVVVVPPVVPSEVVPPVVVVGGSGSTTSGTGTPTTGGATQPQSAPTGAATGSPAAAAVVTAPVLGVLPVSGTVLDSLFTAPTAFSPVALTTPYNPGLLLSAPLGSPLRTMAVADPASAVTTASQVQAMVFDGLPKNVGIPAVIGVLILSGLAGFAVRHRILARVARTTTSGS